MEDVFNKYLKDRLDLAEMIMKEMKDVVRKMRLIDANNLEYFAYEKVFGTEGQISEWISEVGFDATDELEVLVEKLNQLCWKVLTGCMYVIQTEPTAYDVDKVANEIRGIGKRYCDSVCTEALICDYDYAACDYGVLIRKIIETVKDGGVNEGRGEKNDD